MARWPVMPVLLALSAASLAYAQVRSSGPPHGVLILDGGAATAPVVKEFVRLAGGEKARIVVFPTGASSIRFGPRNIILDPDWPPGRPEWREYGDWLESWFGVRNVTILHTRDRSIASSADFVRPLRDATGVFLAAGNAGRYASAYLDTLTQREIEAVLARGGVVAGSSAGAIIQGSFIVRGRPDKPVLIARGQTRGFGFLENAVINPHLTSAKRDTELVTVCDTHPELLGIGIDDEAAVVVRKNEFEVIGSGRVAIYTNERGENGWYSTLKPGDRFDLGTWRRSGASQR